MKKILATAALSLALVGGVSVPAHADRGPVNDTVGPTHPHGNVVKVVRFILRNPGERPQKCIVKVYRNGFGTVHCFVPKNF